jgi:hypothetical protein
MLTYKNASKLLHGDEMTRTLFAAAVLALLIVLTSGAAAQEKNEIAGVIGRTFVSDQGVNGVAAADTTLHSGNRVTYEVNYGRRLLDLGIAGLTLEVPFDQFPPGRAF